MATSSFISTSVFVYQLDNSDPRKQAIAKALRHGQKVEKLTIVNPFLV